MPRKISPERYAELMLRYCNIFERNFNKPKEMEEYITLKKRPTKSIVSDKTLLQKLRRYKDIPRLTKAERVHHNYTTIFALQEMLKGFLQAE